MKITQFFKVLDIQPTSSAAELSDCCMSMEEIDDVQIIPKKQDNSNPLILLEKVNSPLKPLNSSFKKNNQSLTKKKKKSKEQSEKDSKKRSNLTKIVSDLVTPIGAENVEPKTKSLKQTDSNLEIPVLNDCNNLTPKKQKSLNAFFLSSAKVSHQSCNETADKNLEVVEHVLTEEERQVLEEERKAKMIQNGMKRLEKAVITLNKNNFIRTLRTLSRLPDRYVEMVSNPFLKYCLQKEIAQQRRAAVLKNMSKEEKILYKKANVIQYDQKFEVLLCKFLGEMYEDTCLVEAKELCEFPLISLPNGNATYEEFERCLEITEFLLGHNQFLYCKLKFSAEKLHEALHSGKDGFEKVVGSIIKTLVYFLIDDGYKKHSKKLCNLATLTKNGFKGLLKLIQLLCFDEDLSKTRKKSEAEIENVEDEDDLNMDDMSNETLDRLREILEFYQLPVPCQIEIILNLIHKIMSRDSYSQFIFDTTQLTTAVQELKDIECEAAELVQVLKDIPPPISKEEMVKVTRAQCAQNATNEKLRNRRQVELDQLRVEIAEQTELVKHIKLSNRMRIVPLGNDRFHRKYWFFANSPNTGIFIEETIQTDDLMNSSKNEGKKNTKGVEHFLTTLEEIVNGKPPLETISKRRQWRQINSKEDFDILMDCLCVKGIREGSLKRNILLAQNAITMSFVVTVNN